MTSWSIWTYVWLLCRLQVKLYILNRYFWHLTAFVILMSALKLIRLIWKIFNLNLWGENMFVLKKNYVSIIKLGNIRPFWILLILPRCRAVIYWFLGGILYCCIWVWLAGDLTNNNAKSAIRRVSSRLTWTWKMVCIDIFPRLKHDTFWCSDVYFVL